MTRHLDHSRILAARLFAAGLFLASVGSALAEVHYVDVNSTNATPPYTNWVTATTNIQDAVDAAAAGDEVVVTNGVYASGSRSNAFSPNRVVVDKPLALRSVNGPGATTIVGSSSLLSVRCVYLTNGASLSGFTLTRGTSQYVGGGVLCASTDAVLSNCVVSGNSAYYQGGGACGGTLNNCSLIGNVSGKLFNSVFSVTSGGGAASCVLNNCLLTGNSAQATLEASGGGAAYSTLYNCTLAGNSAMNYGNGADSSAMYNCIVPSNLGDYCNNCTLVGCWTADPLFVDYADGNLRLQSNSPCINAGNNAYTPAGSDLDGNPRIVGGTVDIGAYEFQSPVSRISCAWLLQYGLPINAASDTADPDGDGVDNYHEWLAGTNPTNSLSSPAQLTITPSGVPPSGVILTWSTNAVGFTLQSTTNLLSPAPWVTNAPPPVIIAGQNTITNPITGAHQFYRLMH